MSSINSSTVTGKHAKRKEATPQTITDDDGPLEGHAVNVCAFWMHAGVAALE